ncbi:[Clostridium sp. D2Q-11]|uniref:[Citrate [pro-3S]-lyase] ligase n=1 Tax=Anaeromonas frigoriresistens TaxID=2683708 RepID=A0A942Z8W0_9FIRM|nr:[citrate (pro-3S)-lyase] ligase [Anaeromonas frigoriresistens]MBS4538419.1 [citrate (pro-3S)-lyase] ligase [Anaeromonas frigoriresistens]
MLGSQLIEKRIFLDDKRGKRELEEFLQTQDIRLDENAEYIMAIFNEDELIATGSLSNNTLRSIAVKPKYQGTSLLNKVISHLIKEAYQKGITHLFIYTKPKSVKSFTFLGFYEIARVKDVVLMENSPTEIQSYLNELSTKKVDGKNIASIVMNANPFTNGHKYLVEQAAKENDVVHLFVVSEEASIIPFDIRYELIKKGTKHLDNVILHKGGVYMVSSATFPSYFMKDANQAINVYAALDLTIFKRYIVPTLNINRRYVGEEPYCEVTKIYNETMKRILEGEDMEVRVIPRVESQGRAISASFVRRLIKEHELERIKDFVPSTTYEFFRSKEAEDLIKKIKSNTGRH